MENIDEGMRNTLLRMQRDEITGHITYKRLANLIASKEPENSVILKKIAGEEQNHYQTIKKYTGKDVGPNRIQAGLFYFLSKVLGYTFGVKLMERTEEDAQDAYQEIIDAIPEMKRVLEEEEEHEDNLLAMLDEESLNYAGSVVLGLNDALVELTGALAGLSFALQNTRLIALTGLITGISASFSMAASEYLSTKSEGEGQDPVKSAIYTGIAYIITVSILVLPYLIFSNYLVCLGFTLLNAILIIAVFNYYLSVAKDLSFKRRFTEMAMISMGVALISFVVGILISKAFGISV